MTRLSGTRYERGIPPEPSPIPPRTLSHDVLQVVADMSVALGRTHVRDMVMATLRAIYVQTLGHPLARLTLLRPPGI